MIRYRPFYARNPTSSPLRHNPRAQAIWTKSCATIPSSRNARISSRTLRSVLGLLGLSHQISADIKSISYCFAGISLMILIVCHDLNHSALPTLRLFTRGSSIFYCSIVFRTSRNFHMLILIHFHFVHLRHPLLFLFYILNSLTPHHSPSFAASFSFSSLPYSL